MTTLENINIKDVPKFHLNGFYKCITQDVYDGDTIRIVLEVFPGKFYAFNARLYGIDTPEVRGVSREQGLLAREKLIELCTDNKDFSLNKKILKVYFHEQQDKYNRPLATLYYNEMDINNELIRSGHAKEYFGGKKE